VNAGEVVNADISTSVEAETSLAGKNFELFQNYPNPFNARTNIDFKISAESSLLLIAYNSLGEKIAQLAEGVYYPGSYSVSFDAEGLASGIYFYRISVTNTVSGDSFSDIKKLILLK
jgi:hypothetical protein